MKLKEQIRNFHPDADTGIIADQLGIDEDEVISAIHDTPKTISSHDEIDRWLKTQESSPAGEVLRGKWADKFIKNPSPYSDAEFFEIRQHDPKRRKYHISDDTIVVRKNIDGSFFDVEYASDERVACLIQNLRKVS